MVSASPNVSPSASKDTFVYPLSSLPSRLEEKQNDPGFVYDIDVNQSLHSSPGLTSTLPTSSILGRKHRTLNAMQHTPKKEYVFIENALPNGDPTTNDTFVSILPYTLESQSSPIYSSPTLEPAAPNNLQHTPHAPSVLPSSLNSIAFEQIGRKQRTLKAMQQIRKIETTSIENIIHEVETTDGTKIPDTTNALDTTNSTNVEAFSPAMHTAFQPEEINIPTIPPSNNPLLPLLSPLLCIPCLRPCTSLMLDYILQSEHERTAIYEITHGVSLPLNQRTVNKELLSKYFRMASPSPILSLHISHTDQLDLDESRPLIHPLVRVHFVDLRTGKYWKKLNPHRNAIIHGEYEASNGRSPQGNDNARKIDYILPILTSPFDLSTTGDFKPTWKEDLLINEPLQALLSPYLLLLFEIVEFGSSIDLNLYPNGMQPIAWAFLRVIGSSGKLNLGKARLQLYQYTFPHQSIAKPDVPSVYNEWVWQKNTIRTRSSSSLYISSNSKEAPKMERVRGRRPLLPTDIEEGRVNGDELVRMTSAVDAIKNVDFLSRHVTEAERKAAFRKRLPDSPCLIPNSFVFSISAGNDGCSAMSLSPTSNLLAIACKDALMFSIRIFDLKNFTSASSSTPYLSHVFTGHHDLIYELNWSSDGSFLVSSSSDCTVKIWAISTKSNTAYATLPHSSFVYSAVFHPRDSSIVITSGYDCIIRIWSTEDESVLSTLRAHEARINSLIFVNQGEQLVSADANGLICLWNDTFVTRNPSVQQENSSTDSSSRYQLASRLTFCLGHSIHCLQTHPTEAILYVLSSGHVIYVYSLKAQEVSQIISFANKMALSYNEGRRMRISADGKYLALAGTDSNAHIFRTADGHEETQLIVGFQQAMSDIVWSPYEHLILMSTFGSESSILAWEYNSEV